MRRVSSFFTWLVSLFGGSVRAAKDRSQSFTPAPSITAVEEASHPMNLTISSIEDFDRALSDEYARFVGYFPDKPKAFVELRFAQSGIFPTLGWALIGVGEAQALSADDPAILYATITRFIKCAHSCWGNPDERGLHWGGYDFCSLVVHSLYSALLGKAYIASAFCCNRKISTTGYGAYKHAANLMVCLECNNWKYGEKAINHARTFVSAKSNSKTDKAFVGFFLGILADDTAQVAQAITTFSNGYLKSDWGRHKPLTKTTFIHAMLVYAQFYLTDPVDTETHRTLIPDSRFDLWQECERRRAEFERNPHRFVDSLSFLNDLEIR